MDDTHLPTLFEILNRFSKAPLDLWSFYVFLKEQYGGVEYLEFWLDCAAHTTLCRDVAREHALRSSLITSSSKNTNEKTPQIQRTNTEYGFDSPPSRGSSVLYNMLQENGDDFVHANLRNNVGGNQNDASNRMSTISDERIRNKRDTVSRLSEILDNLHMPEYPDNTATSPTKHARLRPDIRNEYDTILEEDVLDTIYERKRQSGDNVDQVYKGLGIKQTEPQNHDPLASRVNQADPVFSDREEVPFDFSNDYEANDYGASKEHRDNDPTSFASRLSFNKHGYSPLNTAGDNMKYTNPTRTSLTGNSQKPRTGGSTKLVRESALRIINTYLTPKAAKEIELPSDINGWSLASDIRQISSVPGGLINPKLFDTASAYVFEVLEREALPVFFQSRALSNVQPVSTSLRLVAGLISLFAGFWLSFVFILLDWSPKSDRCWVILPFGVGLYLTFSSLYRIDPLLAYIGYCEKDGGGLLAIQEKVVRKMQVKRGTFVLTAIVLWSAAFSVLFIFVPGHRL